VVPGALHRRIDRRMAAIVDGAALDRFGESNRPTARLTGLDLARYGYDV
jgi:hypothetical protein